MLRRNLLPQVPPSRWTSSRAGAASVRFLLLFALAALAMAVGIVAILAHRQDRGFVPSDDGRCPELSWTPGDAPIPVYLDDADLEWSREVEQGVRFWSDAAGEALLVYAGPFDALYAPGDPVVVISVDPLLEDHGLTNLRDRHCAIRRAEVRLPGRVLDMRARAVAHELGHALGLYHDDAESSVMYPRIDPRFQRYSVSEADRELLIETYGGAP